MNILKLKFGAPIMPLRNQDPPVLFNGTTLFVKKVMKRVIEATAMIGFSKEEDVFFVKITIIWTFLNLECFNSQYTYVLA